MAYAKIAAAGGQPDKIRFYYPTTDLFNSLDLRTHYRAKMVKDGSGESLLDDVAISQDELDIVKELLEESIFELGTSMFKIAQGVANSIFFDTDLSDALNENCSGFELVDNEAYNANLLPVIDKKILNCIRYFCLREWYGTVGLANDVQANNLLYELNLKKLSNLTFQLRKPTMS